MIILFVIIFLFYSFFLQSWIQLNRNKSSWGVSFPSPPPPSIWLETQIAWKQDKIKSCSPVLEIAYQFYADLIQALRVSHSLLATNKTPPWLIQPAESAALLTFGAVSQSMMGYFCRAPAAVAKCMKSLRILAEVTQESLEWRREGLHFVFVHAAQRERGRVCSSQG